MNDTKGAAIVQDLGRRLLTDLSYALVECEDCGKVRRFGFEQLKTVQEYGAVTLGDFSSRAACIECRRFTQRRNVTIRPVWRCDTLSAVA
ncbi:hypothetical protein [Labrys neptuniae]